MNKVDLSVNVCGISFKNPVIAASGTFGYAREYKKIYDVSSLGGICTKGLTLNKREGNKGTRVHETRAGIMNSVGLQNPGIDTFIEEKMGFLKKLNTNIIVNLCGSDVEEYVKGAEKLNDVDVDMIELNISCPNVKKGGISFGIKSNAAYDLVYQVRKVCKKPLIVKLSPSAEDIVDMALACENAGADAISLVNTFKAMAIDINKRKPVFNNIIAGLSGPCIKPIALRMVYEVCKNVKVPVIGIGGIEKYEDAIEFLLAGASLIQVGTANFIDPLSCIKIIEGIKKYMQKNNFENLNQIKMVED